MIPILNRRFLDWNLLEAVLFSFSIGGALLRLWCFKCLNEYFTFNITIKKNHKLITTGPYSLLVHPSYTGGTLIILNKIFIWYQLSFYVPLYFPFSRFGSFVGLMSWLNIIIQSVFLGLIYKRVFHEERLLREHFNEEWVIYFSQRKRFISYIY
ncbi:ICMT-domain-containing protein [Rhizophagus clarus]|uniref:Protein-S-isoprenylcysteine O-methyltransferase n=1 Tax=Rhizophagus clarus TaxID=94130 RepID=A0A8H3L5D6_9GLOM|nr:ICMT-domain-containing protein [Rhizophagus clarus]